LDDARRSKYLKTLGNLARASHELHQALGYEMIHDMDQEAARHCLDGKLNNVAFLVEDAKALVNSLKPKGLGARG
jgi:hypothetical protein